MKKLNLGTKRFSSASKQIPFLLLMITIVCAWRVGKPGQQSPHQEKVDRLLRVIRNESSPPKDPRKFRSAVEELGKLKATEAIDDLIKLLAYRREWKRERAAEDYVNDGYSPLAYTGAEFPATTALEEIGRPALPALVKVIESNDEASLVSKNARYTVRCIFNRLPAGGADAFFKEQAAHASTPEAARRLLKALETADQDWRLD